MTVTDQDPAHDPARESADDQARRPVPPPHLTGETHRPGRRDVLALLVRRQRWGQLLAVAGAALLLGMLVGRLSGPDPELAARRALERDVLELVLEADAVWTAGSEARGAVSEAFVALRRQGDPAPALADVDAWIEAYDVAAVRIAGIDLPAAARPVQRQFLAALALSRDAVEVLGVAATVDDPTARRDLTTEVGRLRQRSEQAFQSARASMTDLGGGRADVAPLPRVLTFDEGRAS